MWIQPHRLSQLNSAHAETCRKARSVHCIMQCAVCRDIDDLNDRCQHCNAARMHDTRHFSTHPHLPPHPPTLLSLGIQLPLAALATPTDRLRYALYSKNTACNTPTSPLVGCAAKPTKPQARNLARAHKMAGWIQESQRAPGCCSHAMRPAPPSPCSALNTSAAVGPTARHHAIAPF